MMIQEQILKRKWNGKSAIDSFWERVDRKDNKSCWLWTGARQSKGYGVIIVNREYWLCSRFAWVITQGDIPDGLYVLHRCDNPPCCNPTHLFLGTQSHNINDAISKGRHNPKGKYIASIAENVRQEYSLSGSSQEKVARKYGISQGTVWKILTFPNLYDRYQHHERGVPN